MRKVGCRVKTVFADKGTFVTSTVAMYLGATALAAAIVFAVVVKAGKSYATNSGKMILLSTAIIEQQHPEQAREWENVRMRVTAYCPCDKCCGEYADGVTASLHEIKAGDNFVAADSRYAFGTEMVVPGYNTDQPVKVLDRGGAIQGSRVDVFFATHNQALEWGVRNIDVKVFRN